MRAESTKVTSWPKPSWSTVGIMALKKLPIEKVIQCAEARNPALLNLGLLRRLPKRRIKSLQIALTIVLELSERQSFDSKVHILSKWHQAKSSGREAQVDPQFSFQMPWVHKAGQAVYGGEYSSSLYYSVLGVKKHKKKNGWGETGGNKCHTCTTRPITSWASPSLWKPAQIG